VRCPMCRTPTTASTDAHKALDLKKRYPRTYNTRQQDEQAAADDDLAESIETLTLYIGNTHSLVRPDTPDSTNKHNWGFFVRPSRTDLIEEVQIFLVSKHTDLNRPQQLTATSIPLSAITE
jgi:hypothetical protein